MSPTKTLLLATCLLSFAGAASAQEHFHPKGKPPSEHTLAVRVENATNLNLADERDLKEAARGFIAAPSYRQIMADGTATMEGNADVLSQLMSMMVTFTPDFEILPGTKRD